ncbi:SDR family NAD(P)-dependent oxidoreductase [Actinomadura hibisca]|uniref:SDR family NAD(P)-dependent oxidoreductase n=1 Tax=Actinomadura hibisca TaxID=68565 RepID=UPI00082CF93E|nr:SDR family NAD(P)-dependent oxidoreductase [Actinomadura hibisca]
MSGVVIVGAGPGIGQAVALRFAREGLPVALVARSRAGLDAVAEVVASSGVRIVSAIADVTDEVALRIALDQVVDELGPPEVVVYNAALIRSDTTEGLSARGLLDAYAVNVVGAHSVAARLIPAMAARDGGSFLVTGGMPEPKPDYLSLSLGKASVRTLVTLLDQRYGASGVHVASVTVAGPVAPGTAFDPDDIAEHYWRLHNQPLGGWELEVLHAGRSVCGATRPPAA